MFQQRCTPGGKRNLNPVEFLLRETVVFPQRDCTIHPVDLKNCFTPIAHDMNMRRWVIMRVDHHPQLVNAVYRWHCLKPKRMG